MTTGTGEQLKRLDADIERLSTEARALHVESSAVARAVDAARSAARRAQLDEAISPSPEAKQTTAARVAELETLLEKESAHIERARILAEALVELRAQRVPLAVQTEGERLARARVALRERVERGAPAFRSWIADAVALDRIEDPKGRPWPEDRLMDFLVKRAGTTAAQLNADGRDLGSALLAGREV
jgi:hypothetical protein